MTSREYYLAAILAALLAAVAHGLITSGSRRTARERWFRVHLDARILAGYVLLGVSSLLSLWAFRVLPLKVAIMIVPIQQAAVLALARIGFKERFSHVQSIGAGMIVLGMLVFNIS